MPFDSTSAGRDDLAVRVARSLAAGEGRIALDLADRLCRSGSHDDPSHLTLLALAAARLGLRDVAQDRLERALRSDPNFLFAARVGMEVLQGDARRRAARGVLAQDDNDANVAKAAGLLCGSSEPVVAVRSEGGTVRIRLAAPAGRGDAELTIEPRAEAVPVRRRLANAAVRIDEWRFERPFGPARAILRMPVSEGASSRRSLTVALDPDHGFAPDPRDPRPSTPILNIVVPVYDDFDATSACLASLERQTRDRFSPHVVLVNDNSPSPPIRALVASFAGRSGYTVVENADNLGFTGAVNRGLRHCLDGDVLLLNADTVLPRHALDRLMETAEAHPDAGTLTPFSNNGQYTSFPRPFEINPMPDAADLERLSEAAWLANGTAVRAVPSGIGFCLYVRRECMAACRRLGEQFDKGYYEDVELCLRAESLGWRNLCATGVYVAHHGSRSFGEEKALLAARNRTVLDRTYPMFGKRGAAWLAADPLFDFRGRVEDRLPASCEPATMLVLHDEASRLRAERMAADRSSRGERILVAEIGYRDGAPALLIRASQGAPQSAAFPVREDGTHGCADFLRRQHVDRVVIVDPASVEAPLLGELAEMAMPVELAEGDAGTFCPRRSLVRQDGRHCGMPEDPAVCDACVRSGGSASQFAIEAGVAAWRRRWATIAFGKDEVDRARYLDRFARMDGRGSALPRAPDREMSRAGPGSVSSGGRPRLGLLPIFRAALETFLLQELCGGLSDRGVDIVVLGQTLSNDFLLALPGVLVAGPVRPQELAEAVRIYGITHIMVASRRFAPGHPLVLAVDDLDRPAARFAFPFEAFLDAPGGLRLDIDARLDSVAERLAEWVEAGGGEASTSAAARLANSTDRAR